MQLPTRTRRAAMALSVLLTASGSLSYLAAAHRSVDHNVVVPEVRFEKPASVSDALPELDGRVASPTVPSVSNKVTKDIPAEALVAYRRAAELVNRASPCRIKWSLLAAIGRIESNHGRLGRAAGSDKIYGIPLDGTNGTARILDTDGGKLDKDMTFDRAVGPMQFLPSTWKPLSIDGNGDGRGDPQDIHDAALGAAIYLCAGAGKLDDRSSVERAIFSYNHSSEYVDAVMRFMREYDRSGALAALGDDPYFLTDPRATSTAPMRSDDARSRPADDRTKNNQGSSTAGKKPPVGPRPSAAPHPVKKPSQAPKRAPNDAVSAVLSPVQKATETCRSQLTAAQQNAIGGLGTCVDAVLKSGTSAVDGLLNTLGPALNGLLGK